VVREDSLLKFVRVMCPVTTEDGGSPFAKRLPLDTL
jgi:hypothetical protein